MFRKKKKKQYTLCDIANHTGISIDDIYGVALDLEKVWGVKVILDPPPWGRMLTIGNERVPDRLLDIEAGHRLMEIWRHANA